jgi:hypothetical protein
MNSHWLALPVLLGALLVPAVAQAGPFQSPSGNIGCYIEKHCARCDIGEHEWTAPPKPKNCELDWGSGVAVGKKGKAGIVCAGDTTLHQGPKLAYGHSTSIGAARCTSLTSGMRCVNKKSGHGFFVSRQSYKLF